MKIRVLSDLHLEFTKYQPEALPGCGEDLVVLAGDIGVGVRGIEWARTAIPDRPVVYVAGNHEYYGQDWDQLLVEAHAAAAGSHVHFLENEAVEINGLRILGSTLWTDFLAAGPSYRSQAMRTAAFQLSDYRAIRKDQKQARLVPGDTILRCQQSREWLEREISGNRPLLVVTHHAPTLQTSDARYAGELSNAAFHSDFEALIRPPVLAWIHGHSHHSCEKPINGVPVLSNQQGYPGELCGFKWDRLIEVGPT